MSTQPSQEILATIRGKGGHERQHGPHDSQLVPEFKHGRRQKRRTYVQGCRQIAGLEDRRLAAGKKKGDFVVPANLLLDTKPPVEADQVGTTTKQYVLAVINHLAGPGEFVGRRAAAEIGSSFEQLDAVSRVGQRAACGNSRQTA